MISTTTKYMNCCGGLNLSLIEGMLAGLGSDPASALPAPQEGACCVAIRIRCASPARAGIQVDA